MAVNVLNTVKKYGRERQATDYDIIRRMRIPWWINKDTDARTKYEILIVFLRQQWSCQRISILRCK